MKISPSAIMSYRSNHLKINMYWKSYKAGLPQTLGFIAPELLEQHSRSQQQGFIEHSNKGHLNTSTVHHHDLTSNFEIRCPNMPMVQIKQHLHRSP